MRTFNAMLKTEMRLSLRGIDMMIFAICMPVVATIILGVIYGTKPAYEGAAFTFMQQSFGALACIAICAGGVMGLPLVVSEYRQKKVLKRFQVTPVSPVMILAVQVVIYAVYAVASLLLVWGTASLFFGYRFTGSLGMFLLAYLLTMGAIFSIGMMVGGIARDTKVAGVIASLLYFPMLIFSGATLPYEVMPAVLQRVAGTMPLTQGIKLMKASSLGLPLADVVFHVVVLLAVMVICTGVSLRFFRWE